MAGNPGVQEFWSRCREALPGLPEELPDAWAFGATRDQADELLELVLDGTKTGTASALWDYEHSGDALPAVGGYSIILDGRTAPRALIETTSVDVVAFGEVSGAHARAEGEGDRSPSTWREIHERFWRNHSENPVANDHGGSFLAAARAARACPREAGRGSGGQRTYSNRWNWLRSVPS
ncbi:ASCH domain-containing protein [Acidipropionibacterium virtanenii]|uniref:ASCH domain-containing protein n=1 Tax=Acidipropionibacterium virtanenii TaxID=2057246 RepID=A0A344URN4_9ACTN|nr:ASCH domain-containing protein [Acidipropionibacterium virtanenii]AXE37932.1 hypothetical protein JS278_00741 [Acidipropionibacterium virtanenii]